MDAFFFFIKVIPVLIAAVLLGRWFQAELKRTVRDKQPLYRAYLSWPGVIILLAILFLPILLWLKSH
jgi:hypothetical protein